MLGRATDRRQHCRKVGGEEDTYLFKKLHCRDGKRDFSLRIVIQDVFVDMGSLYGVYVTPSLPPAVAGHYRPVFLLLLWVRGCLSPSHGH